MIKFAFKKTSQVPLNFFKKRKVITEYLKKLKEILKNKDFSLPESFLILPDQKKKLPTIENLKLIILIGIGGSSLGTKAVYFALKNKKRLTKILFLDALNPLFLKKVERQLKTTSPKKTLIFLISKSGKTIEVLANFFAIFKLTKNLSLPIFILTEKNSPLWEFGKKRKIFTIEIPKTIPGRYSVFSDVGIFPLSLAKVNVKKFLFGAKKANEICLKDDPLENPALSFALTIYYHWQQKRRIYVNLVFPPDLEFLGKWYLQLMGESLGKKGRGITPIVNIGSNDFHSLGQLYFEGPKDKLVNFIFVENLGIDKRVFPKKDLEFLINGGKKIWQINRAIFEGVKKAYIKKKIPFTEILLPKLNEENIGFLMEMKMIEIIFLAKLIKINAFDQPGVELYKKEARKILNEKN